MKLLIASASLILASTVANAQHHIPNRAAAESAVHRLNKLVSTKKIDAGFETKVQSITLEELEPGKSTDPVYKVSVFQYFAEDKTRKTIDFFLDHMGKPLSFKVTDGGEADGFPEWPELSSIGLIEAALHYLETNADSNADLKPYNDSLKHVFLVPAKDAKDKDVAAVSVQIDEKEKTLKLLMNLDGSFNSVVIE